MNTTPSPTTERRQYHQVRNVFVRACDLLAPIVTENNNVMAVSSFAMTHILAEHFPELSSADIRIVILTVEKLHQQGRLHAIRE